MKRLRIDTTTLVAIALAAMLIVGYGAIVSLSEDFYLVEAPAGSTFSSAPEGLRVLYAYLDEIGVKRETLRRFDELPAGGTILFAAVEPPVKSVSDAEISGLESWVESGGRLVLAGPYAGELLGERYGARRAAGVKAPRRLRPLLPSAYAQGVSAVVPGEDRMLTESPTWATHFKDSAGQVLVSRAAGDGEIVWLAGVYPLSNDGIGEADNARLATLLVAADGPVYFDEYHHGFAAGGGVWERLGGGGRAAVVLAMLAVAVLLWSASQRIAPAIAPVESRESRRGTYITSLAGLYRAAGARAVALDSLAEGLRGAIVKRHGVLETGIARHPRAAGVLEKVSSAGEKVTEQEFVSIAREIARARREVEGRDG